jgi:hypothetical protein
MEVSEEKSGLSLFYSLISVILLIIVVYAYHAEKRRQHRNETCKEILESERTYVKSLQYLVDVSLYLLNSKLPTKKQKLNHSLDLRDTSS